MTKNINTIPLLIFAFSALLAGGCASENKKATSVEREQEIHLKEDRSRLDELRKNEPEETKVYNDESALILNLFADDSKSPYKISSRFNELMNRKREEFSKHNRRRREEYDRAERRKREDFLEKLKSARGAANLAKMSQQERNRFFSEQDTDRRRFFADESEARRDFESQARQERQDFDANMRDMRQRFDGEYRSYSRTYNERKKMQAEKRRMEAKSKAMSATAVKANAVPPGFTEQDMKDLESIPKSAQPLEPTDSQ
jgi:hypothetical protein